MYNPSFNLGFPNPKISLKDLKVLKLELAPFECVEARIKVYELRNKTKVDLLNQLKYLKPKLALLRVAKVTGGAPNKLFKIKIVRLSIAQVLTVISQKQNAALKEVNKNKKYWPLDLQPKKTHAIRRCLTNHQGEVHYFIGGQLDGSQHVEPLHNRIAEDTTKEGENMVKKTAENVDDALRELPDTNMVHRACTEREILDMLDTLFFMHYMLPFKFQTPLLVHSKIKMVKNAT